MAVLTNKQFYIVGAVAAVGIVLVARKSAKVIDAINPLNNDNVIHKSAGKLAAEITGNDEALQDSANHIFGALDLLNPWAPEYRKNYAKQVWVDWKMKPIFLTIVGTVVAAVIVF